MLMGFRRGTNNFAELLAAKFLILFALEKNCRDLQLFGDSKVVCDWLNRTSRCSAFTLRHILDEAPRLNSSFDSFACKHIFSERKTTADILSKEAGNRDLGIWMIREQRDGEHYQYYHRPFMDITV